MRKLVDTTVNRLRLRQVECADLDPGARRRYMDSTVGEALAGLAPGEHRKFLDALLARFPAWGEPLDPEPGVRAVFDERLLSDADFLTARLAGVIADLPAERRRAVALELVRAGLPQIGDPAWPERPLDDVRAALGGPSVTVIDAGRVLELLALFAGVALDLDDVARMTWRDLAEADAPAPRSPKGGLRQAIARCLSGDPDAPTAGIAPAVTALRQLLGHLIGALPLVGRFAAAHVRKFAPAEIRAAVGLEAGGGPFVSREKRCWRKYERVARAFDEDAFADAVRRAVARQVGEWLANRSEGSR